MGDIGQGQKDKIIKNPTYYDTMTSPPTKSKKQDPKQRIRKIFGEATVNEQMDHCDGSQKTAAALPGQTANSFIRFSLAPAGLGGSGNDAVPYGLS